MTGQDSEVLLSPTHPSALRWDITSSWKPSRASQTGLCPFCVFSGDESWPTLLHISLQMVPLQDQGLVHHQLVFLPCLTWCLTNDSCSLYCCWVNEWIYQDTGQNPFFSTHFFFLLSDDLLQEVKTPTRVMLPTHRRNAVREGLGQGVPTIVENLLCSMSVTSINSLWPPINPGRFTSLHTWWKWGSERLSILTKNIETWSGWDRK